MPDNNQNPRVHSGSIKQLFSTVFMGEKHTVEMYVDPSKIRTPEPSISRPIVNLRDLPGEYDSVYGHPAARMQDYLENFLLLEKDIEPHELREQIVIAIYEMRYEDDQTRAGTARDGLKI
jgi:hypothetical protein